jgi:hypothetical protein
MKPSGEAEVKPWILALSNILIFFRKIYNRDGI